MEKNKTICESLQSCNLCGSNEPYCDYVNCKDKIFKDNKPMICTDECGAEHFHINCLKKFEKEES